MKSLIILISILAMGLAVFIWYYHGPGGISDRNDLNNNPRSTSEPITISGEMTCLSKIGRGAQTLECAMGLKGTDGRHYGLKNLFKFDPEYKFSVVGLRVQVSGVFSPEETKAPDGNRYDVAGVIDVASIKRLEPD